MERYRSSRISVPVCILLCLSLVGVSEAAQERCPCPRGPICGTPVTGDLTWDRKVDYQDLKRLPLYWLHGPGPGEQPADGPDPNLYDEKLKEIILAVPKPIVPFRFYTFSANWYPPWPDFRPMPELNTSDAVPFLIDVLLNGPDWSDERLLTAYGGIGPHVVRCYAALCLGAIGDLRAFEPLVEILQRGDYMEDKYTITYHRKDEHNIRSYAAFALGLLGDCRAIDPLVESLKKEKWPHCVYSLARLRAFRAVPTIIEVLSQDSSDWPHLHSTVQYMLKTDFTVTQKETGYVIDAFPELGEFDFKDVYRRLWLHWLEVGQEYAREQFETYYAQRKAAIEENPGADAKQRYLQTLMLKGGIAALPYLMEKMAQGDNTLVPALATLTGDYSTTIRCGPSECIQWWKENQRDWLIFEHPLMAGCLRVPADYSTIQAAIDDANDGDIVLVAPGTYTGDGNRDIDFKGKAITVRSEEGPRSCIIDCRASEYDRHRGFSFWSRESRNSVLDGFTITGGNQGSGAGVLCSDKSSPTIRNCIIVGNVGPGGVGISLSNSDALVSNCVIAGNLARVGPGDSAGGGGGGLSCAIGRPVVQNCAICGNRASAGGGVQCQDGRTTAVFVNCIFAGNEAYGGKGNQLFSGGCTRITGCANVKLINCSIEDEPNAVFVENWSDPRGVPESCIRVDPLFARPGYWDPNGTPAYPLDDIWVDGDYHLKSQAGRWDPNAGSWVKDDVTSLCIDAGDPNSPVGEEPFPSGGRINIGASGGTPEASKSYFGGSTCETMIAGDINGDCRVDLKDLALMAVNWAEGLSVKGDQPGKKPEPPLR